MRLDPDLCRRILFAIEASDSPPGVEIRIDFGDEYAKAVVTEHVRLLAEEHLIEANSFLAYDPRGDRWVPIRLTADGHKFVSAARNDDNWDTAKRKFQELGGASVRMLLNILLQGLLSG